jgi:hypothetical protein
MIIQKIFVTICEYLKGRTFSVCSGRLGPNSFAAPKDCTEAETKHTVGSNCFKSISIIASHDKLLMRPDKQTNLN